MWWEQWFGWFCQVPFHLLEFHLDCCWTVKQAILGPATSVWEHNTIQYNTMESDVEVYISVLHSWHFDAPQTKARSLTSLHFTIVHSQSLSSWHNNYSALTEHFVNLLKPTGHMMHQPFNIQQLYVLPTLYLCVLYLSENKQRLVPLTS